MWNDRRGSFMRRLSIIIITVIISLLLTGCTGKESGDGVNVPTEFASNQNAPSFAVESVDASKGDTDVTVRVSLEGNPGFLTMAMNISYDSSVMALTDAVCGSDYSDYYYIGPKNKESGCTATWFLPDIPEDIVDGCILELHFGISNQAESGSYPVSITRPDNGGIVDQFKEPIVFNNSTGYININ